MAQAVLLCFCEEWPSGEILASYSELPDDVYRLARIRAAQRDMSVSALVRAFLTALASEDPEFERRRKLEQQVTEFIQDFRAGDRLSREAAHDRDALR